MISYARQNSEEKPDVAPPPAEDHIAPAPRVSVQAFCETVETAAAVQSAGEDRRLGKAHLKIQMGGMAAAIEAYRAAPTPNVIILETDVRVDILAGLDQLPVQGERVVEPPRLDHAFEQQSDHDAGVAAGSRRRGGVGAPGGSAICSPGADANRA